jgi:hypothetical protein
MSHHRFSLFTRRPNKRLSSRPSLLRRARPAVEVLDARQLLASAMLAPVNQYGAPSLFALNPAGNVYYNVYSSSGWGGFTPIAIGAGGRAISAGTLLVSTTIRPDIFLLTTSGDIDFNYVTSTGQFSDWSPVGVGVGANAISTGTIPLVNEPYLFLINGTGNVYFTERTASGSWTPFSQVGIGVGAQAIASGTLRVSKFPTVFEPYLFMLNGAGDIYYTQENTSGSWMAWRPVGVGVGVHAISTTSLNNVPTVFALNGAGNIYYNPKGDGSSFIGWVPIGVGLDATALSSVVASFGNYAFLINGSGDVLSSFGNFGTWSKWFSLVPSGSSRPAAAESIAVTSDPTEPPVAFMAGSNSNVYWNYQTSFATWKGWQLVGAEP